MTTTHSESEILKVDALGRVRASRERRQKLLEEFDRSGLSGPRFAALTDLKYQTLAGWLQERKRLQAPKEAAVSQPQVSAKAMQWLETVKGSVKGSVPNNRRGQVRIFIISSCPSLWLLTKR